MPHHAPPDDEDTFGDEIFARTPTLSWDWDDLSPSEQEELRARVSGPLTPALKASWAAYVDCFADLPDSAFDEQPPPDVRPFLEAEMFAGIPERTDAAKRPTTTASRPHTGNRSTATGKTVRRAGGSAAASVAVGGGDESDSDSDSNGVEPRPTAASAASLVESDETSHRQRNAPTRLTRAVSARLGQELASSGLRVFPLTPGAKAPPLVKDWPNRATRDLEQVVEWAREHPGCNWGIATGNGLTVVDIDPRNGGEETWAALVTQHGTVGTLTVLTPSGGRHLYLKDDPDAPLRPGTHALGPGVDVKGASGYVVAPGCCTGQGEYRPPTAPNDPAPAVAPVPDWMREIAGSGRRRPSEPQEDLRAPGDDPEDRIEAVRRCLPVNDPDDTAYDDELDSRDGWIAMLARIAGALGEEGQELAHDWSEQHPLYDATETARVYSSLIGTARTGWPHLEPAYLRREAQGLFEELEYPAETEAATPPSATPMGSSHADLATFLAPALRDQVAWVSGHWHTWDGARWVPDADGEARARIRTAARRATQRLRKLAKASGLDDERKKLRAQAARFLDRNSEAGILSFLETELRICASAFDGDPDVLNVPDGTVDLRTGELRHRAAGAPFLRAAGFTPEPGPTPLFDAFLRDLTDGDDELADYLLRLAGYWLTGRTGEKAAWFAYGARSHTGKSTFVRLIAALLGSYHAAVGVDEFLTGRGRFSMLGTHARARLVTATEPAAGARWDEPSLKALTGDDLVSAERKYRDAETFSPDFKILVVGNHEPQLQTPDEAILGRLRIVPLNNVVPPERRDPEIVRKILDREGPAIMARIVQEAATWYREGLLDAAAVATATADYGATQNAFSEWLIAHCSFEPGAKTAQAKLREAWERFREARGLPDSYSAEQIRTVFPGVRVKNCRDRARDRRWRAWADLRFTLLPDDPEVGLDATSADLQELDDV